MDTGLLKIGEIPQRHVRTEEEILYDRPVYDAMKKFASNVDMREIDGWARSFYTKEGHIESIMQYQKPLLQEPTEQAWIDAVRHVSDEVLQGVGHVPSLDYETDFDRVPFESSSAAGYSYTGKKGEGDNFLFAKQRAKAMALTFRDKLAAHGMQYAIDNLVQNSVPDVAFTRTQLAKLPSIKVRNVFGEAFHIILIEGLSAAPLLEAFKREDTFYVTGKVPATYVPRFLTSLDEHPGWCVALDWSKFDATVQLWEIERAFDAIERVLVFPNDMSQLSFKISRELFKKRKLAAPDGVLWMRIGGIPSGSYFTNLIGSIINYTRIRYVCNRLGYPITRVKVQGDDSVMKLGMDTKPDMLAVLRVAAEHGWEINPLKCYVSELSEDITFLGRSQAQRANIRERLKILRLMCFPEYEVDDPTISTARVRMISEDAGFRDYLYLDIYQALKRLYGEATTVPKRYLTYTDQEERPDVNM